MNNYSRAVSDRCTSGETVDKSGHILYELVTKCLVPASITRALVSDDVDKIEVRVLCFYTKLAQINLFQLLCF